MKTIVSIELTEQQRDQIANWLDNKTTKRLASRADIVKLCQEGITGLIDAINQPELIKHDAPARTNPLLIIAPEDRERLANMPSGYVIGWNKVKHNLTARA